MNPYRRYLWILLLLPLVLWWIWPNGEEKIDADKKGSAVAVSTSRGKEGDLLKPAEQGKKAQTSQRRKEQSSSLSPKTPASAEVDAILLDESISHEQAATQLRQIAGDTSFPLPQREEAIQHGLNLSPAAFTDFAEGQADLPSELAGPLLREMINFNESPADQIRTYLALKDHADPEIAEQAREMLAFMVEDDERKETPERLEQLAREKIRELSQPKDP